MIYRFAVILLTIVQLAQAEFPTYSSNEKGNQTRLTVNYPVQQPESEKFSELSPDRKADNATNKLAPEVHEGSVNVKKERNRREARRRIKWLPILCG